MSLKNPKPGAMSVGHYQISSTPWLTSSVWNSFSSNIGVAGTWRFDFPSVSRFIRVANHAASTSEFCVGFTQNGILAASGTDGGDHIGAKYLTIKGTSSVQLDMRCTKLFVSGGNGMDGGAFDVVAGLTEIPGNMMSLSASNGGSQSGAG
jgi:hypothetical protein